jgi:2,4-dienoyl-CoA reductase (NADPH2)
MTLKKLFTPVAIGPIQLANRIVMPAVHLNYTPEGLVTDQLVHFYVERAAGGVGLIVVGGGRIRRGELYDRPQR